MVIECYDLFKSKFPFSKPVENSYGAGNAWDALYNSKKPSNNYGGNGSFNPPPASNNWGSPSSWNNNTNTNANNWGASNQGWPNNNTANNGWNNNNANWNNNNPNPNTWGNNNWTEPTNNNNWNSPNTVNNNIWGPNPNNNTWGQPVGGMGGMGGMGGLVGTNVNGTIASAQKLVGKQKQSLAQMGAQYAKVIEKVQQLDVTKRSL